MEILQPLPLFVLLALGKYKYAPSPDFDSVSYFVKPSRWSYVNSCHSLLFWPLRNQKYSPSSALYSVIHIVGSAFVIEILQQLTLLVRCAWRTCKDPSSREWDTSTGATVCSSDRESLWNIRLLEISTLLPVLLSLRSCHCL